MTRRHDNCPNTRFVPEKPATGFRYNQKPMRITRSEAQRAAEVHELLREAHVLVQRAMKRGEIRRRV